MFTSKALANFQYFEELYFSPLAQSFQCKFYANQLCELILLEKFPFPFSIFLLISELN